MRLLPHPVLSIFLLLLWVVLSNDFSAGQWVLGALVGVGLPLATARFWPEPLRIHRPGLLLHYVAVVALDIVIGSFKVAWLILKGPARLRPQFLRVPLAVKSDLAISLFANTISLTPGTVSLQVALDRSHLIVHSLDCADADAAIAEMKSRYEAPLAAIFEPHGGSS